MPIAQLKHLNGGARRWRALVCCMALGAAPVLAAAQNGAGQPATSAGASAKADTAWLDRIQQAAQQLSYAGTFVYQRGNYIQSSRVVHIAAKGDGEYERIESLDGQPRTVLRHNDDLYTFVPERHLCVVERRENKDAFPALLGAGGAAVLAAYTVKPLGHDRVAGRDADLSELQPNDANRYTYRLWTDTRTGLLLRQQTLDGDGHVLDQVAFSHLQIGGVAPAEKSAIASGMHDLGGWTVARAPVETVDAEAQGWQLPDTLSGFRKIREVRRPMAARETGAPPIFVNQIVYSDGLATVSVFLEPTANNTRSEGAGGTGATHVLVKRRGDFWVTVLGEVPAAALQQFSSAIEYKPSK